MKKIQLLSILLMAGLLVTSCKKDPEFLMVGTIKADGTSFSSASVVSSDLNGATTARDVALNSKITITFDKAVDVTSVNTSSVKISEGTTDIAATVSAAGSTITVIPTAILKRGTLHTLSISGVKALDAGLFTAISRTFTTEGKAPVVVPNEANQIAYFSFDGLTTDITKTYVTKPAIAITYGTDRFNQKNSTASFDGDRSIIEVLDADKMMKNQSLTLSFWVKTNSTGHVDAAGNPASHFVIGLAAFRGFQFEIPANYGSCKLAMSYELADGKFAAEDLFFNGDGQNKDNGGWRGWDFTANLGTGGFSTLMKDKWVHVICTYNAPTRKGMMFLNGDLMKSQDFNLWPDGDAKKTIKGVAYAAVATEFENILAFGFIKSVNSVLWSNEPWGSYALPTSNHFKGDLDDIRIFRVGFTPADAKALFTAEKP